MRRWLLGFGMAWLSACAASEPLPFGSQTHFVRPCQDSCPAPYHCLCGVCTVPCSDDGECVARVGTGATCAAPRAGDACGAAPSAMCDVECTQDAECRELGERFACDDGRCRESEGGEAGTGGAADAAGTGGGNSPGSGGDAVEGGASGGNSPGSGGDAVEGGGAGEGGTGSTADPGPEDHVICDGSDELRLSITNRSGLVDPTSAFTSPYGSQFLFVDGQCRYYVSQDWMLGIRSGTLSQQREAGLANDISYAWLAEWSAEPHTAQCPPDAREILLARPGYAHLCTCWFEDPNHLVANVRATEWIRWIAEEGTRPALEVHAIADTSVDPQETPLPWPLDRPMLEIEGLVRDLSVDSVDNPARFTDPAEVEALVLLRTTWLDDSSVERQTGPVSVIDQGQAYRLFVVDELPADVQEKVEALRRSYTSAP